MVDIHQLFLSFFVEKRCETLVPVAAVGPAATAPLPKIDPLIFGFISSLLIALGDIDFAHKADMRLPPGRSGALINLPVVVEGRSDDFHLRRYPLDGADAGRSSLLNGFPAACRHPDGRMGLLNQRNPQLDICAFKIFAVMAE